MTALTMAARDNAPGRGVRRRGPKPYTSTAGTLDPRSVIKELNATVPKDWDVIVAAGDCFSFAMTHLRGRPAGKYHTLIDFGALD
jgi:hypothetical protein